jgi:hypothetical protein
VAVRSKAALKRPQSRRCARFEGVRHAVASGNFLSSHPFMY